MTTTSTPPSPYEAAPAFTPAPGTNGLGIASLIVGIIGALLGLLPFVGPFGGFLAFVGLVLGIIGLVLKNKKRGVAIAGTIVSGVGLLLSIVLTVVYTASFVAAVDQSVQESLDDVPSITEPEQPVAEPVDDGAADEVGSRATPAPLGTTVTIEGGDGADWQVTPTASALNVTDAVMAANSFNTPPAEGNQYASLTVDVAYTGPDSGWPGELVFTFVSADGREYTGAFVVLDGQLSEVSELYSGGTASGTVIIEIPSTTPEAGVWGVEYLFGDPIFFSAV